MPAIQVMIIVAQELPADRIQGEFNMFEEFVRAPMPFKPMGSCTGIDLYRIRKPFKLMGSCTGIDL